MAASQWGASCFISGPGDRAGPPYYPLSTVPLRVTRPSPHIESSVPASIASTSLPLQEREASSPTATIVRLRLCTPSLASPSTPTHTRGTQFISQPPL